jgi:hypothetical protein
MFLRPLTDQYLSDDKPAQRPKQDLERLESVGLPTSSPTDASSVVAYSDIILLVCQFGLRGRCRCVCRCVCLTLSSVCLTLSVSSLWRLLHAADRPLLFLLLGGEAVEDLLQRRLRYCVPVPANQWYQIVSQRTSTLYQMTEESLFRMTE